MGQSMKEEFVLPEKWGIKRTIETDKVITNYINKVYNFDHSYFYCNLGSPYLHSRKGLSSSTYLWDSYTEITFEQFKKYVLKMEEKKIIGYKAPYDLFSSKVIKGDLFIEHQLGCKGYVPKDRQLNEYILPKEIVETWEPCYEPEKPKEEIISMGSFSLKVTKEGIFHKNENITSFVTSLKNMMGHENFGFSKKRGNGNWDSIVKDIIFSKTGCENSETKASDWLKVWDKYQEFQK